MSFRGSARNLEVHRNSTLDQYDYLDSFLRQAQDRQSKTRRNDNVANRLTLITLWPTLAILSTLLIGCSSSDSDESFSGTVLQAQNPAAGFDLTDHFGNPASLPQYNDGKVVVLTFLYTYCPDICPIVTHHIRNTHELLGDDAEKVSIVAVSVDPQRDTVGRAREYSKDWEMTQKWAYLVGTEEELDPIWASYFVSSVIDDPPTTGEIPATKEIADLSGVDALRRDIATRYTVSHQAPVYLIDLQGRLRVLHTLPIDPAELVSDIRLLLK